VSLNCGLLTGPAVRCLADRHVVFYLRRHWHAGRCDRLRYVTIKTRFPIYFYYISHFSRCNMLYGTLKRKRMMKGKWARQDKGCSKN